MIDGLKPYPGLRDSFASWIGQVPSHWAVAPNRAIFREINDRNHPSEDMLSVTITRGIVRQQDLLADTSKKDTSNLDKSNYKLVQPADIAYNKMRAWQGAIAASKLRGIISPAYVVMRLHDSRQLPEYFHYLYRTTAFANEAERWSYGITSDMWSLRPEHFRAIRSPLPPIDEQRAIVRFLDYADRRIRKYIAAKRKLIALLEEQKRAIIDRAVTRGLDPNVRLKDSGVPWIGMVPEHWEVMKLRRTLREGPRNGISPPPASSGGVPTFSISALRNRRVRVSEHIKYAALTPREAEAFFVQQGDLLVVRGNGNLRLVGRAGIVEGAVPEGCIYPDILIRLSVRPEVSAHFVVCALDARASRDQIENYAKTATGVYKISGSKLSDVFIALPPAHEQRDIAGFIARVESTIAMGASALERQLALVQEFRTRLIADVVTGKFDVREAAANLPDGPDDEPDDEPDHTASLDDASDVPPSEEDEA